MKKQHPINLLISKGEGLQLDFKFEISDAAKIARSLVAFANTKGGKLLVGVKDNGVIAGVRSEEEKFMIENAAQRFCKPTVDFSTKEWSIGGKKVLEVNIPQSMVPPHKAPDHKGLYKAFFRKDDQNHLANGIMMKIWKKEKSNESITLSYDEDVQIILKELDINKYADQMTLQRITGLGKHFAEELISNLIIMDLIEMDFVDERAVYKLKNLK